MSVELKVPQVGESITEVEIGEWLFSVGDQVSAEEPVVMIETDKVTVELVAPSSGTVTKILKQEGDSAAVGEVIGYMEAGAGAAPSKEKKGEAEKKEAKQPEAAPASEARVMPAAERLLHEHGLRADDVKGTGPGGRILKEDVERAAKEKRPEQPAPSVRAPEIRGAEPSREEEVVPMSSLRKRVAQRLVEAQHTAALLTTFNEVDMTEVMALRKQYKEMFTERHDVKLGFMSFFVKATIEALKAYPAVNARIEGDSIVYHNYFDVGVAVGGGKGLVVPVIRNAERLSFAEVEKTILDFALRAKSGKIKLEELQGGTFTISNGGVYGSMMSTPIVNPPQSGILGLHAITERPAAVNGQVLVRPMMYLALTYDHRIVDGREAVGFLKRIKECIEQPARILLEI